MGDSSDFLQRLLENSRVVKMKYNHDVFEVKLDVENYEPGDLSVKVQDEHLIVTGKHESKQGERGSVARNFTRRFLMPEDIDADTLTSNLSPEGILTVNGLIRRTSKDRGQSIQIDHMNNLYDSSVDKTERNKNLNSQTTSSYCESSNNNDDNIALTPS